MIPELNHFQINWVNGMKITQKHYIDSDNAVLDGIRDSRMLSLWGFYYGILPKGNSNQKNFDVDISASSNSLNVVLKTCRAVTSNGERIEIINQNIRESYSIDQLINYLRLDNSSLYSIYIIIQVDSFKRTPWGEVSKDELPTRQPFTVPNWKLDFVLRENFKNSQNIYNNSIVIGKIKIQNQTLQKEEYIPPCMSISSQTELSNKFNECLNITKGILKMSLEMLKFIRTYDVFNNKFFAIGIKYLTENTVQFIIANITRIEKMGADIPPIEGVCYFSELLNIHHYIFESLSPNEMSEFQNIINDLPKNEFSLDKFLSIASRNYNHEEIYLHLIELNYALNSLANLNRKYADKLKELHYYWNQGGPQPTINQHSNQPQNNIFPSSGYNLDDLRNL